MSPKKSAQPPGDFFAASDDGEDTSATTPQKRDTAASRGASVPLAERMRPHSFARVVGHSEVFGEEAYLVRLIEKGGLPSLIFWGPPGCGKTTLARIIAAKSGMSFTPLSAVISGIKEVKEVIEQARTRLAATGRKTILFVDEIHRFNKAQQDAFLPHVEDGTIILFGATTENPSFSVIAPLLSRARVIVLKALTAEELAQVLRRALEDPAGLGALGVIADDDAIEALATMCDGDARRALNLLEQCALAAPRAEGAPARIAKALVGQVAQRTHLSYDKTGEEHFNIISALHKSLRASDPQAALYWMARMLASGEDPLYVARRMVRFASEDIGLADPNALTQALAAVESYRMLGSPEGELALAQAAVYLATCPKSNSVYAAFNEVNAEIKRTGSLPTPMQIRNAPTQLMKGVGYGKGYQYDHDSPDHFSGQECLPDALVGREFYAPGPFGYEKEIEKRLKWWNEKRADLKRSEDNSA